MQPIIVQKEAMFIAGVTGSGDETAKAWEAFMKIQKMHPLENQANEPGVEGYEVRLYPPASNAKVHVGMKVKDANVPAEYKVISLPAGAFAGFEVYLAKGYESGNAEMNVWLEENRTVYKQALLDGMKYIIVVYDGRYKGEKDPASVVGILIPVISLAAENFLRDMVAGAVKNFSVNIGQYAGAEIREKVMRGGENMSGIIDAAKGALDYKNAIDRLDSLADKAACHQIMTACGSSCQAIYDQNANKAKEKRQRYATEAEFLADFRSFDNDTIVEIKGRDIIQHYKPSQLYPGMRCACMLIGGLPAGTYASPTVCECSRAFTERRWETILGRPVKAEVVSTPIINDTDECTFIIHL